MPVLNLRGDWFALQDNIGIHDIIDVSRVTLIWNVQNIIDLKDQMQFKVLLIVEPQLRGGGAIPLT